MGNPPEIYIRFNVQFGINTRAVGSRYMQAITFIAN